MTDTIKNKAAMQLGKLGGLARAKKLTKEQLTAIGRQGGRPKGYRPAIAKLK